MRAHQVLSLSPESEPESASLSKTKNYSLTCDKKQPKTKVRKNLTDIIFFELVLNIRGAETRNGQEQFF